MVQRMPLQARHVKQLAAVDNLTDPPADTINDINPNLKAPEAPSLQLTARTPAFDMGGLG